MQVSIKNTSSLGRTVSVAVPKSEVDANLAEKMNKLSRTMRLDGFRAGKIPLNYIKKRFGSEVRQEVVSSLVESSLKEALEKHELNPAGQPVVDKLDNDDDSDLSYEVSFEIYPEIKLPDFAELTVKKPTVELAGSDIDDAINKITSQFADWVDVDRAAEDGDMLKIDYEGSLDGVVSDKCSGSSMDVEIGCGNFIEGFEKGLIGLKSAEETTLDLSFPDEYVDEELSGQSVQFKIKVLSVQKKQEVALDDEFANKIGAKDGKVENIRPKVEENLNKLVKDLTASHVRDNMSLLLLEKVEVELPSVILNQEISAQESEYRRRTGEKNIPQVAHDKLIARAKDKAKLGMILGEVIKIEKLTPSQDKVQEQISNLATKFGPDISVMQKMLTESNDLKESILNTVLIEQALEFVIDKANVQEENISFKQLNDYTPSAS